MKTITKREYVNFTHKTLWGVVLRQLENAEKERKGSYYDDLATMVFALHAFEAYLNYIGLRLAPDLWKDERNYFRREPYRGFEGKVRKIFKLCGVDELDRKVRPYSTIWTLKNLRDLIAHGKLEEGSEVGPYRSDDFFDILQTPFASFVSHDNALQARDDVLRVASVLHNSEKLKIEDIYSEHGPFGGILGHATESPSFTE